MSMVQDILPALLDLHMRAAPQSQRQRSEDELTAHFSKEYMGIVVQDVQNILEAAGMNSAAQVAGLATLQCLPQNSTFPELHAAASKQPAPASAATASQTMPLAATASATPCNDQRRSSAAASVVMQSDNTPAAIQAAADTAASTDCSSVAVSKQHVSPMPEDIMHDKHVPDAQGAVHVVSAGAPEADNSEAHEPRQPEPVVQEEQPMIVHATDVVMGGTPVADEDTSTGTPQVIFPCAVTCHVLVDTCVRARISMFQSCLTVPGTTCTWCSVYSHLM